MYLQKQSTGITTVTDHKKGGLKGSCKFEVGRDINTLGSKTKPRLATSHRITTYEKVKMILDPIVLVEKTVS